MSEKYKILVLVPGSGQLCVEAARMSQHFTHPRFGHECKTFDVCHGGPNFSNAFTFALNAALHEGYTHAFVQHTDVGVRPYEGAPHGSMEVEPGYYLGDCLLEDMDRVGADAISAPIAHKDDRFLSMVAIGTSDPWSTQRRFSATEIAMMPPLFCAASIGYQGYALLHGTGCMLLDLRREIWQKKVQTEDGVLHSPFAFNYVEDIIWDQAEGKWKIRASGEDWGFWRACWQHGVMSWCSSRVTIEHFGMKGWSGKASPKDGVAWLIGSWGDQGDQKADNEPLKNQIPNDPIRKFMRDIGDPAMAQRKKELLESITLMKRNLDATIGRLAECDRMDKGVLNGRN